jgi:hypothetical protein
MLPKQHAAYGAVAALALAPFLRRGSITFWAASVFVDADHYLWYAARSHDFNLLRAYRFFLQRRRHAAEPASGLTGDARPWHGPVSVALLWLLVRRWRPLRPVFFGVLLHALLDAYSEHRLNAFLPLPWRALQ